MQAKKNARRRWIIGITSVWDDMLASFDQIRTRSEPAEQADHLTEDPHFTLPRIDDERSHGGIFRLEDDARAVAQVALHGRLAVARRVRRDHRDHDVVR